MKSILKYFTIGALIFGSLLYLMKTIGNEHYTDEGTKRACMQYALKDHEKEFVPARWTYLKTMGNPNDVEFWYNSCVNHHAYPVGGKENEWVR